MRRLGMGMALAALLLVPAGAQAADRDGDRLPDGWEKKHGLSTAKKSGKKDPDRDGLRNRAELRTGHEPRDRDSDDDGISDGAERAGVVKSFANGVLTIDLANGTSVSGRVTASTEIECESDDEAGQHGRDSSSDDGGDDRSGRRGGDDDRGDDDEDRGEDGDADEDRSDDRDQDEDRGDDGDEDEDRDGDHGEDEDDGRDCSADALTPGAAVHEAEVKVTSGGLVFTEVELAK